MHSDFSLKNLSQEPGRDGKIFTDYNRRDGSVTEEDEIGNLAR